MQQKTQAWTDEVNKCNDFDETNFPSHDLRKQKQIKDAFAHHIVERNHFWDHHHCDEEGQNDDHHDGRHNHHHGQYTAVREDQHACLKSRREALAF